MRYTFKNGSYYPTITYNLTEDFTTYVEPSAEVVISDNDGNEFHRDDATILHKEDGEVAYDLDGVGQFNVEIYSVVFDLYDEGTKVGSKPGEPIDIVVEDGPGGHSAGSGSVPTKPDDNFGNLTADYFEAAASKLGDRFMVDDVGDKKTVSVPEDYDTIQEAVDDIPAISGGKLRIEVADGTYNEDVLIPPLLGGGKGAQEVGADDRGPFNNVEIVGNPDSPTSVTVDSMMVSPCVGASCIMIDGFAFTQETPYEDGSAAFAKFGPGEVRGRNLNIEGTVGMGFTVYGGSAKFKFIDIGVNNCDTGFLAKRHASVLAKDAVGTANNIGYYASGNSKLSAETNLVSSDGTLFNRDGSSHVYNDVDGRWAGGRTHFAERVVADLTNFEATGAGNGLILTDANNPDNKYRVRIEDGTVVANLI